MANRNIFISYRRDDAADEAKQLEEQLEKLQGHVFRDISAIEIAEKFPKRIEAALNEAGFVIVVIGKKWLSISDQKGRRRLEDPNDFVRREIKYSLRCAESDKFLDIIPVLVQGARMPKAEELPGDLRALAEINAHRIGSETFTDDVEELSKRIKVLIGQHSTRADEFLDELDEALGGRTLGEAASVLPAAACKPELRGFPELATWLCTIGGSIDLRFETKESGAFEGRLLKPRGIKIEGTWRLLPGSGDSLVMTLEGSTFDGEDITLNIPIERNVGERSYSGKDSRGNYCRLEWTRRREASGNRF
ncbi:MAG: toll/interleukin-1 receptor domain-containing protein [Nitrospiraceae bacterium]|nr:MAG: toll/interleukin-1 receptor domain-containing protein [Nitrospiraceae bacterium]